MTTFQNGDAGLNAIAKTYGVPKAPLKRLLDSGNKYANGSKKCSGRPQTLPPVLETALAKYVLDMESMLIGLSRTDLMELANQLANANGIDGFKHDKQSASTMWYRTFMKRHPELSLRKAEATSVARAKRFNRVNVGQFFYSLETLVKRHNLGAAHIFNVDESGITIVLYCIVLYCIVLYCIVLYCIVLYCIVLYCIVLYCIVLYCIVLYCIVLYCIVLYCIVLYCIVLYCIVLYCIVLYCIVLYCIVLYCIVLYCIVLYCIVLYCIVLYCIVLYCIVLYVL